MTEIRVVNTTIVVEESSTMHGLIDLSFRQFDPDATLTASQARLLAEALQHYAQQADSSE